MLIKLPNFVCLKQKWHTDLTLIWCFEQLMDRLTLKEGIKWEREKEREREREREGERKRWEGISLKNLKNKLIVSCLLLHTFHSTFDFNFGRFAVSIIAQEWMKEKEKREEEGGGGGKSCEKMNV